SLREREKSMEQGGLSGKPLFPLATRMLAETYVRLEGAMPVIGVGGIDSGQAAVAKLRAGATLVQLYSGLIFHGLTLLTDIKRGLLAALEEGGHEKLGDLVGIDAADITAQPWPV
ncbi:MAG: dihydroorotate dehydrogenase (quinone), partial [Pseudorhodoplanes sp.]